MSGKTLKQASMNQWTLADMEEDRPFGPPPEEYNYRCSQCKCEIWVNEAIIDFAQTENTRGQMTFLAGAAELQSGNSDAAHERFLTGVSQYPGVYESYLGLVELVKAEVAVDDFQRGLVDFNAYDDAW